MSCDVKKKFAAGDREQVSKDFFWARSATGTISNPPHEITDITGPWDSGLTRAEVSALGGHTVIGCGLMNLTSTRTAMDPMAVVRFGKIHSDCCLKKRTDQLSLNPCR